MTAISRKKLFVDDEELQIKLMQRLFVKMGYPRNPNGFYGIMAAIE